MAASPYKLSCSLYGHNLDVRSVTATHDGKIISGSRDNTAKVWVPNEAQVGYREKITLQSHNNFVSCVSALPPNSKFPQGLIITGSNDQNIRLFSEDSSFPIQTLTSHTSTVCKISIGVEENTILSSSWDKTAKLWDLVSLKVISTFSGHEAAVWSVVQLPDGVIATASADKKIKIWIKSGSCIKTLSGHTDCVRDLAVASPQEILSCANDATVRHWNVEAGTCINTFYGHGNYIYSIAIIGAGTSGFVTSSEDKTVRLWVNGEVAETIQIPAISVWSVAALPNSDIVVGSNDGVVRVFSADSSRQATPEQLKAYEAELAALETESSQDFGGFKLSELPGPEALYEPGKKDGQTRIIKENNNAVVYNWSSAESQWVKLGDVMGSANNVATETGKTFFNGKEYDYVFNVDIEEGKPPLKLPYNKTDDPWLAAQKFIHDNNLSQYYLEQVANFIVSNSTPAPTQSAVPTDFIDPFTGGARYIPQTSSTVTNGGVNPSGDPFTGSSRYTPVSEAIKTSTYFPQREFLRFDQANLKQILEKLLEFNKKTGDGNQMINEFQIQELIKICEPGSSCTLDDISRLDLLLEWPQEIVFPVLDVMRLAIRNNDANRYLCDDKLIPGLMKFLTPGVSIPPNNMLALRVINNMLAAESGQILASKNKLKLLHLLREIPPPYTKPLQVAMATLLLNISVILRRSETPEGREEAISVTNQLLPIFTDQEALFRALVALGTLLYDSIDRNSFAGIFTPILMKYIGDSTLGPKLQECSQQILNILQ